MRVMPVVRESQLVVPGCSRGLLERDNRADAVCGGESVAASRWRRLKHLDLDRNSRKGIHAGRH